jgi:hypothetical protein
MATNRKQFKLARYKLLVLTEEHCRVCLNFLTIKHLQEMLVILLHFLHSLLFISGEQVVLDHSY